MLELNNFSSKYVLEPIPVIYILVFVFLQMLKINSDFLPFTSSSSAEKNLHLILNFFAIDLVNSLFKSFRYTNFFVLI